MDELSELDKEFEFKEADVIVEEDSDEEEEDEQKEDNTFDYDGTEEGHIRGRKTQGCI